MCFGKCSQAAQKTIGVTVGGLVYPTQCWPRRVSLPISHEPGAMYEATNLSRPLQLTSLVFS